MRSHHENKLIVHPSMCMFIWDTKKIIPRRSDFIKAKRPDFLNEHVKNIVTRAPNKVLAYNKLYYITLSPTSLSPIGPSLRRSEHFISSTCHYIFDMFV